jgi:aristolochene synthase
MAPSILNEDRVFVSPAKSTVHLKDQANRAQAVAPVANVYTAPQSRFVPKCHPQEKQITEQVDGYFLTHWPFKTEKDRKKFVAAGFSRVTCLYFPMAKDDRIHFACRLLTLLFLIDGMHSPYLTKRDITFV